ncbi:IS110 family transposase [Paenibacillus beijingensis]|uniref:Uncharacterized protein n=1 Tax=Paenibacillus beijingensis TaxID=1126833 RepID=A0A0D5NGC8_9BACL|nr:IS110 family transposase [Paenibacillus beijingensis]AJY74449.1 hypothetical protein VN24_07515 [Paenibacillus beijingensis]
MVTGLQPLHLAIWRSLIYEVKDVARAVSYRGIALGSPLEFGSHNKGFQLFGRWIQDLLKSYKLSKVIVGMEPAGHYWLSLARQLSGKGMEAVLINPHVVKKN